MYFEFAELPLTNSPSFYSNMISGTEYSASYRDWNPMGLSSKKKSHLLSIISVSIRV